MRIRTGLIMFLVALWSGAAHAHDSQARYIANEGVLVTHGDIKVLFDPLPRTGFGTYMDLPRAEKAKVLAGDPPYDGVDVVFVSHAHRDHFSTGDMVSLMKARTELHLVAPGQAIDMMRDMQDWNDGFLSRITRLDMAYKEAPRSLQIGDVAATAVRIAHAGWPAPQRVMVQNMTYRVTLGDGPTVMHMGDADVRPEHYTPFADHWSARRTDMGFPPYWFFLYETGPDILNRQLNISQSVGTHVPLILPEELGSFGADFFSMSGESRMIPHEQTRGCRTETYKDTDYTICEFPVRDNIRLFWGKDRPFTDFDGVDAVLAEEGKQLVFAMNAGMYHPDRRPVGLYQEPGRQLADLKTKAGPGNFGMLPNGVLAMWKDGDQQDAAILETGAYMARLPETAITYATQSGPMLVIDGKLHPKFRPLSTSRHKRNGVGVSADGHHIYFVISEEKVNFHSFASLFKDHLGTPNALYLDGNISRLHDPANGRSDPGLPMGPIVGVVDRLPLDQMETPK